MGLLNIFKSMEAPVSEPAEAPKLKRVPAEKNDGHWTPRNDALSYNDNPEMIAKIREQMDKEYAEIKNDLESRKN